MFVCMGSIGMNTQEFMVEVRSVLEIDTLEEKIGLGWLWLLEIKECS